MATSSYTLDLRSSPKGGDLKRPSDKEINGLRGAGHLLLLVHGYNDCKKEADKAYDIFERAQRRLLSAPSDDYTPGCRVVRVYWPGDADWGLAGSNLKCNTFRKVMCCDGNELPASEL